MQHFHHGATPKGSRAGQQLVEDDAQREDVAPTVEPMALPSNLFGTHVGRRAGDVPFGERSVLADRQSEVGDIGYPRFLFDQDVGRLYIAVDQPLAMSVIEGPGDGGHELAGFVGSGPLFDPVGERGALDELGDDVDRAIRGATHVVDGDDVGMVERRGDASLGEEELRIAGILEPIRRRYLDRDLPLELLVECQVNAAECPLPQQSEQSIATELLFAACGFQQAVRFRCESSVPLESSPPLVFRGRLSCSAVACCVDSAFL